MHRSDLQLLAETRLADAEILIDGKRWSAAYYLLGYAVECGLKACAVKQFRQDAVPDKKIVNGFYTHNFGTLLAISGIKDELEQRTRSDIMFQVNWKIVNDWSELSRYDHSTSEAKTRDMSVAVNDSIAGVLTWLKKPW